MAQGIPITIPAGGSLIFPHLSLSQNQQRIIPSIIYPDRNTPIGVLSCDNQQIVFANPSASDATAEFYIQVLGGGPFIMHWRGAISAPVVGLSTDGYGIWLNGPPIVRGPVDQVLTVYVLSDMQENSNIPEAIHGIDPGEPGYDGRNGTDKLFPLRSLNGRNVLWGEHPTEGFQLVTKVAGAIDPATVSLASIVGTATDPWDGRLYDEEGAIIFERELQFWGSSWKVSNPTWGPRQMRTLPGYGGYTSTYAEDITAAAFGRLKIFLAGPTIGAMLAPGNFLRITRGGGTGMLGGREVYAPMPIVATFPDEFPGIQAVEVNCNLDSATFLSRQINTPGLEDQYDVCTPGCLIVANVGPQDTPTPNDAGLLINVEGAFQIGDETIGGTFYGTTVDPHCERLAFLSPRVIGPWAHDNCLIRNSFSHHEGAMRIHNAIFSGDVSFLGDGCPTSIDSSYSIAAESVCRQLVVGVNPATADPAYRVEGQDFLCTGQFRLGGSGQRPSSLIIRKGIRLQDTPNSFCSGLMVYDGCVLRQIGGHTIIDSSGAEALWNKGGKCELVYTAAFGNLQFIGTDLIRSGFAAGITLAAFAALGPPIIMAADPSGAITYDILTAEPPGYQS